VPWTVRFPTQANHTATHLLHGALREVLGDHVRQAGSSVRPDKLRFDFAHGQPLTSDERDRVERLVNERIFVNHPVRTFLVPLDEARTLGATMLFGEKYGDVVRVVEVGDVSRELCGGAHVRTSAEIGAFKILSESSVGASTRRVEAVTSGAAAAYLFERDREVARILAELESERRAWRKLEKELRAGAGTGTDLATDLLARAADVAGVSVIAADAGELDADALLDLSDRLRQKADPAVVVLGARSDGRANVVANLSPAAVERGLNAGALVKAACAVGGGGGGGRANMARGGGLDPEKIADAIAAAEQAARAALS
jgi:alanyl-tRNA synthetase